MEEIVTARGGIVNKKNAKALYDIAKHFDTLLVHNGASWNERFIFAKEFMSGNGLYIPDLEIRTVDVAKTIEKFVDECIKAPTPAKKAYINYLDWCKDNGVEPLLKQRFISVLREVAIVKSSYQGMRNVIFVTLDYTESTIDTAKKFIKDALANGKMQVYRLDDMAYRAGISKESLKRAKKELYADGTIKSIRNSNGRTTGVIWYVMLGNDT